MFDRSSVSEELLGGKKKGEKHQLLWFDLTLLFLEGVFIGLGYLVFYSPYLKVREIEVHGNRLVSDDYFLRQTQTLPIAENCFWNMLGFDNILSAFYQVKVEGEGRPGRDRVSL